jgi:hypothetical protein
MRGSLRILAATGASLIVEGEIPEMQLDEATAA